MFKPILICATLGGVLLAVANASAATPAVPTQTKIASPAIEHAAFWYRGSSYPYRWRGAYYHHRRWFNNGWRYW
jgi:hypothetical protein